MTKKQQWQRFLYHTNPHVRCAIDYAKSHKGYTTEDAYLMALIEMTEKDRSLI